MQSAKFLTGNKELRAHESQLSRLKLKLPFPDATTEGFIHKGVISCAKASGCTLVWLPGTGSDTATAAAAQSAETE